MPLELTAKEARVLGCLLEKSITTPDQYPLTLNALTTACNQKSSRDPVMNLEPSDVHRTTRDLAEKHVLLIDENFKSQTVKFTQRLCNTPFSDYQFEPDEYAIVCLLLLRGPQTPGELRARSGRLHAFEDHQAVVDALGRLIERDGSAVVQKLPRKPGRKDAEYMHLLSGPIDVSALEAAAEASARERPSRSSSNSGTAEMLAALTARVDTLEAELAELKASLGVE